MGWFLDKGMSNIYPTPHLPGGNAPHGCYRSFSREALLRQTRLEPWVVIAIIANSWVAEATRLT